jgi:3',5'-cyclic AMP phosphodiesterase CpdA
MFTLAHLSDPHLSPFPAMRMREFASKRVVGYMNWRLRRSGRHDPAALAAIVQDVHRQRPDHIAVLGDLINVSSPSEFGPAAEFLARLGKPHDVSLVPGNHDAYVRTHAHTFLKAWDGYLRADQTGDHPERFPYVRRRGPVAIVGLSTAIPTLPFLATGKLGKPQLEQLARLLPAIEREGLFRVVLIHHPPVGLRPPHKVLTDADAFRAVIAAHGAELILHGHDHRQSLHTIPGPGGGVPVIGVPSASAPVGDHKPAAWNLYRIAGAPGAWTCEMHIRGLQRGGSVAAAGTQRLEIPGQRSE